MLICFGKKKQKKNMILILSHFLGHYYLCVVMHVLSCRVCVVDPQGDDRLTFGANLVQLLPGRFRWQYEVIYIAVYSIYCVSQS